MEIFRIENLSFSYPAGSKPALDNVSLCLRSGEMAVLCGRSGCGKTTLLRMLKRQIAPHGKKSGRILYCGTEFSAADERAAACEIGFVMQNPENQTVTDKVWHELAFGLENMGLSTPVIRRRVGEMASFFGIQDWFRKETALLSGGQKQLLNLASIMVMQPKVLLLDEPTSQLDPIAAADFIATLKKLNQELGLTILLAEHRLEEVFPAADRVIVMEEGRILIDAPPREAGAQLQALGQPHPMMRALPSAVRIYHGLSAEQHFTAPCPLTVKEGRAFLSAHFTAAAPLPIPERAAEPEGRAPYAAELKQVWFRYERDLPDILRGVSLRVARGEIYCILGGNGTGKTTTLNVVSGLHKAYRGSVRIFGKKVGSYQGGALYRRNLAFLPQNPQTVFLKNTVKEDFDEICKVMEYPKEEKERLMAETARQLEITALLEKHPYDLSGGEQQKCALAKMLLLQPQLLLLDEPTKGIDAFAKESLCSILKTLKAQGMTILMVSHDVEFACETADRCALFFDGEIISEDIPKYFFAENNFYTTAANRIARQLFPNAVTCEDVIRMCGLCRRRDFCETDAAPWGSGGMCNA